MNLLITDYGEYLFRSFYGKKGIFTLVGTTSPRVNSSVLSMVDRFVSETGKEYEATREEIIFKVHKEGLMKPVPGTEISAEKTKEVKPITEKKNDKNSKRKTTGQLGIG